jgi:GH15 family glucan-1,4-alpha-glucosidase
MTAHESPTRVEPAISDYGFLSDCHSAALVDRTGSVDWWCVPRFDSPSVFGRLLDPQAGHWTLSPRGEHTSERSYVGDSLVVTTVYRSAAGAASVTDALLLEADATGHDIGRRSPHVLARRVEGLEGVVRMRSEFAPRMEYGRTEPHLRLTADGAEARGGPSPLPCTPPSRFGSRTDRWLAEFDVAAGEAVEMTLTYSPSFGERAPTRGAPSVDSTLRSWTSWAAQHTSYDGDHPALVRRSSLVLQGLTYGPSGAIVAAATTSLPETMGGEDNYDYRTPGCATSV